MSTTTGRLQRSLAELRPDLCGEYSPNNSKGADEISPGSSYKALWVCAKGHEYVSSIYHRTSKRPTGCSVCNGKQVVKGVNDLLTHSPHLLSYWSLRNNTTMDEISMGSSRKFWWVCEKGHEWEAAVSSLVSGRRCPYCSTPARKVLPGFNDLATTHPHLVGEWGSNNTLLPEEVLSGSHHHVEWVCSLGHLWTAEIKSRAIGKNGCPQCSHRVSVPERILSDCLSEYNPVPQFKICSRVSIDLFLPKVNVAIEYDGWYWHKDRLVEDTTKTNLLLSKNLKVVRIRESTREGALPYIPINNSNLLQLSYERMQTHLDLSLVSSAITQFIGAP